MIAIGCTLFRGMMTFFKMISSTQYLTKMTAFALRELYPFILVLIGQNMIFAILFVASGKLMESSNHSFMNSEESYNKFRTIVKGFMNTWDMMNGMGSYKPQATIGMVFYFLFTTLTNIAMLNVVISVVSDTYVKVCCVKMEVNMISKAELLYDYALLLSFFST